MKKKKISGAEAVIHSLLNEGVDLVWGYPGGAIMPVYDEFYKFQDKLKHILAIHEQRAYAHIDSTPVVFITGQVPSHLLGSDSFQETDIIGISMPVTKWNYQITKASEIPEIFAKAFYIAKSGRPGPVLIDITKDAQFELFDYEYSKCKGIRSYNPLPKINSSSIDDAVRLINKAKKPFIVWGQGVILGNAEDEFKSFVEKSGIPAAWTILGASALPTSHELNVGMVGMHGNYGPNLLTNECDLLVAIGMRFDDRVTGDPKTYANQAKIIHLDIDPAEINKNIKVEVPIIGDCKESLKLITEKIEKRSHEKWISKFDDLMKIEFDKVINSDLNPSKKGLTMGESIIAINEQTNGEAIIVTDVGQHQMVACRYANFIHSKSNITSGGLGTMGFALPAAMGAKMGAMNREVVAVIGDGGYQMTIQELGTIFQLQIPVKIVILNNDFLGMVRQWQQLFFDKRYASTEMINPDFVTIAKGYYLDSERVNDRKDLRPAVERMIKSKKPYVLEICVEKEDNVFPMIPSGASVSDVRLS